MKICLEICKELQYDMPPFNDNKTFLENAIVRLCVIHMRGILM
jgi:hypothetical protein